MKFGIIYGVDLIGAPLDPEHYGNMADWDPKLLKQRGVWRQTEKTPKDFANDYFEYGGRHGKWCALLTKQQLQAFLQRFGFDYGSLCNTMGALGMPGNEPWYGCAPAWSFDATTRDGVVNAYITPWPDVKKKTGKADRQQTWDRIKKAMECLFT